MVEADDDTTIQIADFGFAKKVPKPNCLKTLCGTAQYVAPEVLDLQSGGYDHRADMWSVGVVVYILLGGYAPFEGPVQELAKAICKADYCFHDKYWSEISDAAKSMISSLLEIDVERRLSAEEALQCPWMTIEEEALNANDLSGAQEVLQKRREQEQRPQASALDLSFTAALGTEEEVMNRMAKRTTIEMDTLQEEDNDNFVIEDSTSGKPFDVLYSLGDLIDEGDFPSQDPAFEAKHKQSGEIFAVRRIERAFLDPEDAVHVQNEVATLKAVSDSPFVIKLFDVFEEPDYTFLIMERPHGGTLIDRIVEKRYYTENDARVVMKGVLSALEHCHNKRICVRNIKTESILCLSLESDVDVKLSDFGFAKRVPHPFSLETQCGTEGYVAPEILSHRPAYDVQVDIWSAGVVMYIILGGYRPFRGEGEEVMKKIRYGDFKFHKRYWSEVSEEAKLLIARMLTVNPIGRITATAALQDEWISLAVESLAQNDLSANVEMLRDSAITKVKAAVNSIIATKKLESMAKMYHASH